MASKITVISRGTVFMAEALAKNLVKAGFAADVIEPDVNAIGNCRKETDIYLIYAGKYVSEITETLLYLKDILIDDEKQLCIVGSGKEIDEVENVIPDKLVSLEIVRPFETKVLIDGLKKLSDIGEESKNGKMILLIDDDLIYLKTMQEWLSSKYNAVITKSGIQAMSYLSKHTPDLILLDYEMPITSGPQVMQMIRNRPEPVDIPIIFLTGKSDKESVMNVMELNPQGYLLKTMTKEQILDRIDYYFATKKWNFSM